MFVTPATLLQSNYQLPRPSKPTTQNKGNASEGNLALAPFSRNIDFTSPLLYSTTLASIKFDRKTLKLDIGNELDRFVRFCGHCKISARS